MAREFMEPFYFKKMEGTPLDGVGVGYCGGPTGATTPDETDATNNNHHNSQQSSLHPNSTTSSSTTTTTTTTSNNMNNNNNTTTDMMDAMKRKWVLFQANLDTMLQGIGFPQPFNRRRTGEGSGGGGGPGTGGGDKESTALTTTDEKKRNHNDTTSSNPSRANAHHHQAQLHHRTGEAAATNSSSSTSPSDAAVVVQQEHIEMALLSQGELRLGVGHDFVLKQLSNPTWCDKCGDFIWGVYKQCLKCRHCQYTCHEKCRQLVTLDCKNSLPNSGSDGSIETSLSEPASTPGSNSTISDTSPNDETDSGYRSGPIPEEILPKKQPSQATLNREDLKRKLQEYNNNVSFANLAMESDGETFQGFIKVTLNLIRPITMSLGARPPSIYEVLTREHIVEQNTQSISFYMPRDTVKSIHVDSETTTKEVISALLKKFKILDNPRKFAMYEQELQNGKIVKLRRVLDAECPLQICLGWGTENLQAHRLVLQENEATGDIEWSNFSLPELNNFLKVLDREQDEHINQLQYKYRMMKKVILQRLKEIRKCRNDVSPTSPSAPTGNGNHSPGGQTQKVI